MCTQLDISRQQARIALKYLTDIGIIEEPTGNQRGTNYTLCKSSSYADLEPTRNQRGTNGTIPDTHKEPTRNQQPISVSDSYADLEPTRNQRPSLSSLDIISSLEDNIYNNSKKDRVVGEEKKPKATKPQITFIPEDDYRECFELWLQYKKERRESYKSDRSVQMCYNKLKKLSNNSPEIAMQIIEQSIANNWAGLFELKTNRYGTGNTNSNTATSTYEERMLAAARVAASITEADFIDDFLVSDSSANM
jgi:hypothetical protein